MGNGGCCTRSQKKTFRRQSQGDREVGPSRKPSLAHGAASVGQRRLFTNRLQSVTKIFGNDEKRRGDCAKENHLFAVRGERFNGQRCLQYNRCFREKCHGERWTDNWSS